MPGGLWSKDRQCKLPPGAGKMRVNCTRPIKPEKAVRLGSRDGSSLNNGVTKSESL